MGSATDLQLLPLSFERLAGDRYLVTNLVGVGVTDNAVGEAQERAVFTAMGL